jgi:hypothetical protein
MDVSAIASGISDTRQGSVKQAAQIAVLKKAIDMEAQSMTQLLAAVPSNPPNLGNNIDVRA